jgi:hypothetical protein
MSIAMKDKFLKYWTDVHGLMAVATVLDPRFKMKFLYAMFTEIYGHENVGRETTKVKDLLVDLVKEYQGSMEGFGTTVLLSKMKGMQLFLTFLINIYLLNLLPHPLLLAQNWICIWKRKCWLELQT